MKNYIYYQINKIYKWYILLIYNIIRFFYRNNNKEFQKIIALNRTSINNKKIFLTKQEYEKNTYGIPGHIFLKLDKPINKFPTYSDLFIFFTRYLKKDLNYLEIGVSVLKNYIQLADNLKNTTLTGYDINPLVPSSEELFNNTENINPELKNVHFGSNNLNNNKYIYFQGSVLDSTDADKFNSQIVNKKFNFIFSDALHEPDAVKSEYKNIIKNNLDTEFILYFDDLGFDGLEETIKDIYLDLKIDNHNLYYSTFYINGWIGQHEKLHKNGVISTVNLYEEIKKENIKLPLLRNCK